MPYLTSSHLLLATSFEVRFFDDDLQAPSAEHLSERIDLSLLILLCLEKPFFDL